MRCCQRRDAVHAVVVVADGTIQRSLPAGDGGPLASRSSRLAQLTTAAGCRASIAATVGTAEPQAGQRHVSAPRLHETVQIGVRLMLAATTPGRRHSGWQACYGRITGPACQCRKTRPMTLLDACCRGVFRVVYPFATLWWRLYGHTGILVAIWLGEQVLLVGIPTNQDCDCHQAAYGQERITVWRPSGSCKKKSA